jgi:hypothetical protein
MKYIFTALVLFIPCLLSAYMEPLTVYTKDRYFVTTGEINFTHSIDEVSITLLKYNDYSRWAFVGMDGVDKESEGLLAYFTDIVYSVEENLFFVTFDINLIWPFGRKGRVLKFEPHQKYDGDGNLESITLIPLLGTKMVEEAEMVFHLQEQRSGTSLYYESKIKLTKFLDFFFSLRSYKKNFEWYVYKMSDNLYEYMREKE